MRFCLMFLFMLYCINYVQFLSYVKDKNHSNLVFVTATSKSHFNETMNQLYWMQKSRTNPVIVLVDVMHDLTEHQRDTLRRVKDVRLSVEPFNYTLLGFSSSIPTKDVMNTIMGPTNSLWKPAIVMETHRRYPHAEYIIWMDASIYFSKEFFQNTVWTLAKTFGVLVEEQPGTHIRRNTHPRSFEILQELTNDWTGPMKDYKNIHSTSGSFIVWYVKQPYGNYVMHKWMQCAYNITCMAPPGARGFKNHPLGVEYEICKRNMQGGCHRGDQSILSILLASYSKKLGVENTNGSTYSITTLYRKRLGMHSLNSKRKSFRLRYAKLNPSQWGGR